MNVLDEQFLSVKEVCQRLSIGKSTVWAWSMENKFPKPVRLSSRCTRWRLSDIVSWEQDMASANDEFWSKSDNGAL